MALKKKIVISGSIKLRDKINKFVETLKDKYEILDYPIDIAEENFLEEYKKVHNKFYNNIENADVLLLFNEDKNGIKGYIGYAGFSEISYAITQNLLHNKSIEIYLYKMPSKDVSCYEEINLWLNAGWIKLYK